MPSEEAFAAMHAAFVATNPSGPEAFGQVMGKLQTFITGDWGWTDTELAGIDAPARIEAGDRDFMPAEHAAAMAAKIPDAWLAILPDTRHMTIMTRTDQLLIEHRISTAEQD